MMLGVDLVFKALFILYLLFLPSAVRKVTKETPLKEVEGFKNQKSKLF